MDGEIAVATTPTQCVGCNEEGCPGKDALDHRAQAHCQPDGPSESEDLPTRDPGSLPKMDFFNSLYRKMGVAGPGNKLPSLADIIAKQAAERERLLNSFNEHTAGALSDIMTGKCTEYLIIYKNPKGGYGARTNVQSDQDERPHVDRHEGLGGKDRRVDRGP